MRFESSLIGKIPPNMMVVDWFPQQDLLGKCIASLCRVCSPLQYDKSVKPIRIFRHCDRDWVTMNKVCNPNRDFDRSRKLNS